MQVWAAGWTVAAGRISMVLAALALGFAGAVSPAAACSVCIDLPDDTLTDRIWNADTVALGRSDPANPFTDPRVAFALRSYIAAARRTAEARP